MNSQNSGKIVKKTKRGNWREKAFKTCVFKIPGFGRAYTS